MERRPLSNEQEVQLRPLLEVDLSTGDGLPFNLVAMTAQQLEGDDLARFNQTVWLATQQGSGAMYNDLLRIVDSHVDLVDTSDAFPFYGRESKIQQAVGRLNDDIAALPESVTSHIDGMYPEMDNPDMGVEAYQSILSREIERVENETVTSEHWSEGVGQYRTMLVTCKEALRRYNS